MPRQLSQLLLIALMGIGLSACGGIIAETPNLGTGELVLINDETETVYVSIWNENDRNNCVVYGNVYHSIKKKEELSVGKYIMHCNYSGRFSQSTFKIEKDKTTSIHLKK